MEIESDLLARLRSEHGDDLHKLEASEVSIVARPPTNAEYRRFRAKTADERTRPDALEELALSCLIHPSRAEFEKILQRKPALADVFGAKLLEIAGITGEADAKKL